MGEFFYDFAVGRFRRKRSLSKRPAVKSSAVLIIACLAPSKAALRMRQNRLMWSVPVEDIFYLPPQDKVSGQILVLIIVIYRN